MDWVDSKEELQWRFDHLHYMSQGIDLFPFTYQLLFNQIGRNFTIFCTVDLILSGRLLKEGVGNMIEKFYEHFYGLISHIF